MPPTGQLPYIDVSLATPDEQFNALTAMLESDDGRQPAPNTHTPPYGETISLSEYVPDATLEANYLPPPDFDAQADTELLSVISDAPPVDIPEWDWENDPQYFGLGVPPGVPNDGPVESGHSQIILANPSAEYGMLAWSGKPVARVARHENDFKGYSAGTSRGHERAVEKISREQAGHRTQQARDLLLAEVQRRGIHNVVVADIAPEPYTQQVVMVDPSALAPQPEIGPEGVLP